MSDHTESLNDDQNSKQTYTAIKESIYKYFESEKGAKRKKEAQKRWRLKHKDEIAEYERSPARRAAKAEYKRRKYAEKKRAEKEARIAALKAKPPIA